MKRIGDRLAGLDEAGVEGAVAGRRVSHVARVGEGDAAALGDRQRRGVEGEVVDVDRRRATRLSRRLAGCGNVAADADQRQAEGQRRPVPARFPAASVERPRVVVIAPGYDAALAMVQSSFIIRAVRRARAVSSVGRALPLQGRGHWFEPSTAHRSLVRSSSVPTGRVYRSFRGVSRCHAISTAAHRDWDHPGDSRELRAGDHLHRYRLGAAAPAVVAREGYLAGLGPAAAQLAAAAFPSSAVPAPAAGPVPTAGRRRRGRWRSPSRCRAWSAAGRRCSARPPLGRRSRRGRRCRSREVGARLGVELGRQHGAFAFVDRQRRAERAAGPGGEGARSSPWPCRRRRRGRWRRPLRCRRRRSWDR